MCTKKLGPDLCPMNFLWTCVQICRVQRKNSLDARLAQKLVTLGKVTAGTFSENESEVLREMNLKSTKREIRNSWQAF